jgi:hypothetical protein
VIRRLVLYLRSRLLVISIGVMVACAGCLWTLGRQIDDPYRNSQFLLLLTVLAITALAPGLGSADPDLDRAAGLWWPPRRAAHLVLGGAVAFGLMAFAAQGSSPAPVGWIARDAAGVTGLLGLGAAALGAGRAPVLCLLWTAAAIALPTVDRPAYLAIATWMMQPAGTMAATVTAMILAVTGVLAYAHAGSRR